MSGPIVRLEPASPDTIETRLREYLESYPADLHGAGLGALHDVKKASTALLLGECGGGRFPTHAVFFDIVDDVLDRTVGYLWTCGNNFGFGTVLYIKHLLVDPPHRRLGYATSALETLARAAGTRSDLVGLALAVMPSNDAARALYRRLGFTTFSEMQFRPSRVETT